MNIRPRNISWAKSAISLGNGAPGLEPATKELQFRAEVVNLVNNVILGNPDTEIGSPGSDRANAGRINSTACSNADPQRNFQFAVKFQF